MDDHLRRFLGDLDGLGHAPDPAPLSDLVGAFARDLDYWQHQIERAGGRTAFVHQADDGPQVALVRRTDGTMSYVHSHQVWVAMSAIVGVETHRHFEVEHRAGDEARLVLAEERQLHGGLGEVVTLVPPHDVHSHGHVHGSGEWPWTVIVLGDDQLRYEREEFDLDTGRRRVLPPGDRGTADLPPPG